MARFNWKEYEEQLTELAFQSIEEVINDHPEESFYAAAFHTYYSEEDGMIGIPMLGVHSEEGIDEGYSKWSPPDWYWNEVPFIEDAWECLHVEMEKEACRADTKHWYKTHARFMEANIKVAKALTRKLNSNAQTINDFVVMVSDEESQDYDALIQQCMSKSKYKKLFSNELNLTIKVPKTMKSAKRQWKPLLADLNEHRLEILKMGTAAVPLLVHAMTDPTLRDNAAAFLGNLRIPDPDAIAVLRQGAATGNDELYACAGALAILGDLEFIFELSEDTKTREIARSGIKYLYHWYVNNCATHLPLNFGPLERYFEEKRKPALKDLWAGCRTIEPLDLDEALRGLKSRHAEIRILAACMLGKSDSIRRHSKKFMPALVEQLTDRNREVRRRTLRSIEDCGKLAKPYMKEIRRLKKDSNEFVRYTARRILKELK